MWALISGILLSVFLLILRGVDMHYLWMDLTSGRYLQGLVGLFILANIYLELFWETSSRLLSKSKELLWG